MHGRRFISYLLISLIPVAAAVVALLVIGKYMIAVAAAGVGAGFALLGNGLGALAARRLGALD